MAKPEPRQESRNFNSACSSTSPVLWFEKHLLSSYYVRDTASLEDSLKDQVPVLENLDNNCKDNTISVRSVPNWRFVYIYFTQISQIQRLSGINQET